MTETLAQFFISVAGVIIMILLAVIAYFLQKWISSNDSLIQSVNDLKTAVAVFQTNQGNSAKVCNATHLIIDNRLNDHAKRLNEHGELIAELSGAKIRSRKIQLKNETEG